MLLFTELVVATCGDYENDLEMLTKYCHNSPQYISLPECSRDPIADAIRLRDEVKYGQWSIILDVYNITFIYISFSISRRQLLTMVSHAKPTKASLVLKNRRVKLSIF